ncbi:MAG TPA: hypothetical protein PKU69_00005, partial [Bacillota bacterium]|nr:hypothetical protein [Bacillota bacterium]
MAISGYQVYFFNSSKNLTKQGSLSYDSITGKYTYSSADATINQGEINTKELVFAFPAGTWAGGLPMLSLLPSRKGDVSSLLTMSSGTWTIIEDSVETSYQVWYYPLGIIKATYYAGQYATLASYLTSEGFEKVNNITFYTVQDGINNYELVEADLYEEIYTSLYAVFADQATLITAIYNYLSATQGYVSGQTAIEFTQYNTSTSETTDTIGKIVWDASKNTLSVALSASHIYNFGEQLVVYVLNKTGATLTKGTPVYVYGEFASSGKVLVDKLSYAPADYPKALKIAGVMAENVANNGSGFVIFRGLATGLDMSAYSVGDNLYIGSTAGTLTNVVPTSPNIKAAIGMVINNSATEGTLLVSRSVHHNLSNLSDVLISSASNLDVLAYDSVNARWRNYDLMSYLASSYLALDGSNSMGANLNMASHKIVNVTDGSDPGDAVNKGQVDADLALKADLVGGLVPSTQLPSYVDDVLEYATYADLPVTGEAGKIYVVIADETSGGNTSTYRWATSVYIQVTDTLSAAQAKVLYESNADTNAFTDAEKTKLSTLLSGTYYYSKTEIDLLLEQLKTVYGLEETVIDTLAHNGTVALADLTDYDYLTIYLKHTETSTLIFDGKLIDPALFVNNGDFIQINAFDAGTQRSYGKLTYDGSTNLTFTASDTADTLVIHGYKKESIEILDDNFILSGLFING